MLRMTKARLSDTLNHKNLVGLLFNEMHINNSAGSLVGFIDLGNNALFRYSNYITSYCCFVHYGRTNIKLLCTVSCWLGKMLAIICTIHKSNQWPTPSCSGGLCCWLTVWFWAVLTWYFVYVNWWRRPLSIIVRFSSYLLSWEAVHYLECTGFCVMSLWWRYYRIVDQFTNWHVDYCFAKFSWVTLYASITVIWCNSYALVSLYSNVDVLRCVYPYKVTL